MRSYPSTKIRVGKGLELNSMALTVDSTWYPPTRCNWRLRRFDSFAAGARLNPSMQFLFPPLIVGLMKLHESTFFFKIHCFNEQIMNIILALSTTSTAQNARSVNQMQPFRLCEKQTKIADASDGVTYCLPEMKT